jgi:hypothetical protein
MLFTIIAVSAAANAAATFAAATSVAEETDNSTDNRQVSDQSDLERQRKLKFSKTKSFLQISARISDDENLERSG